MCKNYETTTRQESVENLNFYLFSIFIFNKLDLQLRKDNAGTVNLFHFAVFIISRDISRIDMKMLAAFAS